MTAIRLDWKGLNGAIHAFGSTPKEIDKEIYKAVLDSGNLARRTIRASVGGTPRVKAVAKRAIRVRLEGRGRNVAARVMGAELGSHKKSLPGLLASMQERGVQPYGGHPGVRRIEFMERGTDKARPLIDARLAKLGDHLVRRIGSEIKADR